MNYYPFHIGDYKSHTSHLSPLEDIAYRRLIDLYYQTEMPITLDIAKASKLIGMRDASETVSEILSDFFLKTEEGYRNKRCDDEIAKYKKKAQGANHANQMRWGLKSDVKSDVKRNPNQEPITNNQKKTYDAGNGMETI